MINLKIDPEFQSQIPPLTDDEFKQLEENILKEGKLLSPLIVWNNTLVDGHNRYAIRSETSRNLLFHHAAPRLQSREEVTRLDLQKSAGAAQPHTGAEEVPHWKAVQCGTSKARWKRQQPAHDAAKKTAPEELCQI